MLYVLVNTIQSNFLIALDKYNKYCKVSKDKLKDLQDRLKYLVAIYEKTLQDVSNGERQVKQILKQQDEWKANQLNAIERLRSQVARTQAEMAKLNEPSSSDAYEKIKHLETEIEKERTKKTSYNNKLVTVQEAIDKAKEESQNYLLKTKEIQYAISKINKEIDDTKNHSEGLLSTNGAKCQVCYSVIDAKNFKSVLEHNKIHIAEHVESAKIMQEDLATGLAKRKKVEDFLTKLQHIKEETKALDIVCNKSLRELEQQKIVASSLFRENANAASLLLEQQVQNYNEQIEAKQKEMEAGDPFGAVLETAKEELKKSESIVGEFKSEITNLENQVPYYEFWIKAFGDTGIRSFVIGEIMPILNSRINYWLQFLVDNKIKLNFNDKLEETIERNPADGDPFAYEAMSGGEHQRIDLGIALAFAQVMMFTSGTCPSLVTLDEVGTNLDRPGIHAVYNMICELARERQVLITTHDPDLLEMLSSHDTITVIKEDGYTRLK